MHTSREERERAGLFCFVLQPFKHTFPPTHPFSGDSYTRRRRSSYAYQLIGQPAYVCFSFVLPPFASHVMGVGVGGGFRCLLTLNGGAFGMHASGSGGQVRGTL